MLTKSAAADSVLDGDVRVSGKEPALTSHLTGPPEGGRRNNQGSENRGRRREEAEPYAPPSKQRIHDVGNDGLMRTNRKGLVLCQKFQRGECGTVQKGGPHADRCPANHNLVHQCAKCLSQFHGAFHPTECREQARVAPANKGGRKGGKGRGKDR